MKRTCIPLALSLTAAAATANENIEELSVIGRNTNLVGSAVSASEGFVDQSEIRLRPLLRTGELIELVPGMVATQHSGTGKANQYFLRGFNLDHGTDFATFVDGMPVNMRTHGHGQGYTDLNFLIPELIDSLAYKKGPYYAEVGDFSGAGSAFFNTASTLKQGEVSVSAGQDDYFRVLVMNSQSDVLGGEFLYAFEQQEYSGPWTDIDEDLDKTNFLFKHTRRVNDGDLSITLMGYDNSWNSADQIPERAVRSGLISELGSLDTTVGGESSRYSLSVSFTSELQYLSVYAIDYEMDLFSNFTYFLDDPVNGDQFQQIDDRRIFGAMGHQHFDSGDMRNTIGFETRYDDIDEVGLYKSVARERLGAVRSDEVQEFSFAVYLQNRMQWTEKFRTTLGVRYDYYDFDVDSLIDSNINGYLLSGNNGSADDDILSLKGSATYKFSDSFEAYVAAGQGFHSNDARGTTITVDPVEGTAVDPVDPLVESTGYEIGFRAFFTERLNASVALWTLDLDSELLFVGDAGNTEASRASTRSGLELTAYYRIDDVWTVDLEYAVTDAEFDERDPGDPTLGDEIPGAIEDVLQLGVSARFSDGYFGSVRVRHFGERPLEESGTVKSDSSTVVNALIGKDWDKYGVQLEILNLFDSNDHDIDYFYESRLAGEVAGVEDVHYHVIEPRTVRISGHIKF